ncbi:MAG: hypothetical protein OEL89_03920 [Candidatus Peregrinibacteria bacterium]|nr:hypothetical protein [Candidatus Peregrinibacteria bacterium]
MYAYELTNYTYIPVSLNILTEKKKFHLLNGNYMSCEFSLRLMDKICAYQNGTFVVDLKEINLGDSRCFTSFNEIFKDFPESHIIFVNFNEIIKDFLVNDCSGYLEYNEEHEIISCSSGLTTFTDKIKHNQNIQKDVIDYITSKIKENVVEEEQLIRSSNVFVNKYIDLKSLFLFPAIYYLLFFELALLINDSFDEFCKLICCSYNGAVTATILGQLLNTEVIFLMNLGPSISYNNIEMVENIENGKKYLFVADMICLGSEFNLTKTIVKLRKADLLGVASIINYLKPWYSEKTVSLIDIQDNDSFDYCVKVKKVGC